MKKEKILQLKKRYESMFGGELKPLGSTEFVHEINEDKILIVSLSKKGVNFHKNDGDKVKYSWNYLKHNIYYLASILVMDYQFNSSNAYEVLKGDVFSTYIFNNNIYDFLEYKLDSKAIEVDFIHGNITYEFRLKYTLGYVSFEFDINTFSYDNAHISMKFSNIETLNNVDIINEANAINKYLQEYSKALKEKFEKLDSGEQGN